MPDIQIVPRSGTKIADKDGVTAPVFLNWFGLVYKAIFDSPTVYKGIVAPTTTPNRIGDFFIDTVHAKVYCSTGLTSSADWKILN